MIRYYFCFLLLILSCSSQNFSEPEFSGYNNHNQITVKKVNNFRFLGGIRNTDGKILRDSLIYRSGNLHNLKQGSFNKFEQLGLKKVIDLRTKQEIAKEPDHLPSAIKYENFPAFEDKNDEMANAKKLALKGKINGNDADARMIKFYKDYVSENPHIIKNIITEVLNADSPILYHCTAGKDRTGIITALIFKILKFDDKIIFEEYLQSNNLRQPIIEKRLKLANTFHFAYPKLDIAVVEKTSWVERKYLEAAFKEVNEKYGSMDHYIHDILGINESQRNYYIQKFLK